MLGRGRWGLGLPGRGNSQEWARGPSCVLRSRLPVIIGSTDLEWSLLLSFAPLRLNRHVLHWSGIKSARRVCDVPPTERAAAILGKDRAKLEALMSPQFTLQGWDGSWQVERPQWLENTLQSYDIAEYHHADIVPHVYGDVAAITSKWYWRGKRGRDEKKPFEEHGYCVDIWRQANGKWQVVSRLTIIMPGKEEPGSKHD